MFVGNYNPSNREAGKGELKNMQRLFKNSFLAIFCHQVATTYVRMAWPGFVNQKETSPQYRFLYFNLPGESRTVT